MNQDKKQVFRLAGIAALVAAITLGGFASAMAEDSPEVAQVRQAMVKLAPGATIESIEPSVLDGIYEVLVGTQLYYVSKDGKYLLNGKLYDLATRTDLTSAKTAKVKAKAIDAVGEENMIIFAPEKYDHTVTVFTDLDCGYCRKLHKQIDQYNDLGIRVRYLLFPRAGLNSASYNKAVSVWCADDRKAALTSAKLGKEIEPKTCDNPVAANLTLGQSLGVTGTPAIFLEDGEMLPGYLPPQRLAAVLKEKDAQHN